MSTDTEKIPRYLEIVNELGGYVCGVVAFMRSEQKVRDRVVNDPKFAQAVLHTMMKRCIPLVDEFNALTAQDVARNAIAKAAVNSAIESAIKDIFKDSAG